MRTEVEAADSFIKSDSGSLTGLIYTDSKILPQDDPSERFLKRTLLVDEKLREQTASLEEETYELGQEWVDNQAICQPIMDYGKIWSIGITNNQTVSMLNTQQSTDENALSNQLALAKAGIENPLLLSNNLNSLMNDVYDKQCQGDILCVATFSLC